MTRRRQRSSARGSLLVLSALSCLLMTGCNRAVFDALSAGALNFIQTGVTTTLTTIVFGAAAATDTSTEMDETTTSGGEHTTHDG